MQGVYNSKLTAKKRIQTNQMENLIEIRKLDKEILCAPNTRPLKQSPN